MISRTTVIGLLVVVVGLSGLAWWQAAREDVQSADQEVALFDGFQAESVTAVRVDSVVRDQHFRIERDASGRWQMTDPVSVPANAALVDFLVRSALARHGAPVAAGEADPRVLGLEPPRVVLDLEQGARRQRLELGALDLDGEHLYVRSNGRLLRTLRDLDTTLDRSVEDFKATEVVDLDVRRIVEVHRAGSLATRDVAPASDLSFDALSENGGWRMTSPTQVRLDPLAMHLWIQGCARMRIKTYVQDGAAALADYGLDPPEVVITLVDVGGAQTKLQFGRPGHRPGGAWFERVGEQSYWCQVDTAVMAALTGPPEDLFDARLSRLPVESIDGLVLRSKRRELVLARAGTAWTVAARALDGGADASATAADPAQVADLLGKLDKLQFVRFAGGAAFEPLPGGERLTIRAGSETEGGVFGSARDADGPAPLASFRRDGDTAIALVDPIALEWLDTPVEQLWSTRVLEVLEAEQASLSIAGGGVQKSYAHGAKGLWTLPGVGTEARDLSPALLESLLFVRAAKHRPAGLHDALREPITIEFTSKSGNVQSYVVGVGEGDAIEVEMDGRRAVLKDQRVHARLKELLGS